MMKKVTEALVTIKEFYIKKLADTKFLPYKNLSNNTEILHDHDKHHQAPYFQKVIVTSRC